MTKSLANKFIPKDYIPIRVNISYHLLIPSTTLIKVTNKNHKSLNYLTKEAVERGKRRLSAN